MTQVIRLNDSPELRVDLQERKLGEVDDETRAVGEVGRFSSYYAFKEEVLSQARQGPEPKANVDNGSINLVDS